MCGLAGAWNLAADVPPEVLRDHAATMASVLTHRGPDDAGDWVDEQAGLALGHRRLAILDLSPLGRQPMVSASGRHVIVYNGEIYNYRALQRELEASGITFLGSSDTEVLLEACERWGPRQAATRANGMFAFALWDRHERTLTLVRDRLGIKPLYVGRVGSVVLFGSELGALRRHPAFDPSIDRGALAAYLRRACVPAPHTIYRTVRKVLPGSLVTIRADGATTTERFWDLQQVAHAGLAARSDVPSDAEALAELDTLLSDAVTSRLISDVPLGAFLSGGIDSSTIVALMQRASSRPVRTYSIGSRSVGYDEAPHARAVAAHLGTDHTELYVDADEALEVIPQLPTMFDEPFADPTQIPNLLVARLARRDVTVALSGDGGDEVFGGYTRHVVARSRLGHVLRLPVGARRLAGRTIQAVAPTTWDAASRLLPARRRPPALGDQLHKAAGALAVHDLDELYTTLASHWLAPDTIVVGANEPLTWGASDDLQAWLVDPMERMLYRDTLGYLPDDALTKVDRTTMAVSLEGRVPFLDDRVVEFAWRLPPSFKVRDGRSKWLVRALVEQHVPRALLERPKQGFGIPLDAWLRGPLREWAEDLLAPARLRQEGYLRPEPVQERWRQHLAGTHQWQYPLWNVLIWQQWLEAQSSPSETRLPAVAPATHEQP
jgi:asparagine synthase (glutamine-hydrolysing)